jgi:3-hydroxy-3-methylglutaryl-CoA-synthase
MSLFTASGNTDIEGATVVNACYGGTAALLNGLAWLEGSGWDGRYAIVVAADIAVYADGPARPTGGCGAVAMLLGRDAPLAIDLGTRAAHASHVWDFFKPNLDSEYPAVNGALSQTCYLQALDDCYNRFVDKSLRMRNRVTHASAADYIVFHSPYNKLVQKSFGRLMYLDMLHGKIDSSSVEKWLTMPVEQTYEDKELETALKKVSANGYKEKVDISCKVSKQIGNTYTAAVYMNLSNLVFAVGENLVGKKVVVFSYGSGALASMFSVVARHTNHPVFNLGNIQRVLDISNRLAAREKCTPAELQEALQFREESHGFCPFLPKSNLDKLATGTYFLEFIGANYERVYRRKGQFGSDLSSFYQRKESEDLDIGVDLDRVSLTDVSPKMATSPKPLSVATLNARNKLLSASTSVATPNMRRNTTQIFATGRPNIIVVVTGVSAALPGRNSNVFSTEKSNIQRIIDGEVCITNIPPNVIDDMLEKNIVELVKGKDGKTNRVSVRTHEQSINVSASLGQFSLTAYGVAEGLVGTMDRSVQVAIAAGLEALKDAGIVTGENNNWALPASMQDTTGVVYATSFPALDTAIEEVSRYFKTKSIDAVGAEHLLNALRHRLQAAFGTGSLSEDTEKALQHLVELTVANKDSPALSAMEPYEFDRKFLFRVLVLGNAQLAQIIKARGPNMQTNAACAGATQAIAIAYDLIQVGRAERVVVIAGDSASSDVLLPWLGAGFRSLGAATICSDVTLATRPFHPKRSGMILGSGGIGIVLESEAGAMRRFEQQAVYPTPGIKPRSRPFRCRLLGTLVSNSAFHGAAMDRNHIAQEFERFISSIEKDLNISRKDIARRGCYFSHETQTHASPSSSCAANEIYALRQVFGEELQHLLILNTKGFTGHPMGVSFEDVVAAEVLVNGQVPPIANYSEVDPALGPNLKLSQGGYYPAKYALRFAAGFGSQIALALYGAIDA